MRQTIDPSLEFDGEPAGWAAVAMVAISIVAIFGLHRPGPMLAGGVAGARSDFHDRSGTNGLVGRLARLGWPGADLRRATPGRILGIRSRERRHLSPPFRCWQTSSCTCGSCRSLGYHGGVVVDIARRADRLLTTLGGDSIRAARSATWASPTPTAVCRSPPGRVRRPSRVRR